MSTVTPKRSTYLTETLVGQATNHTPYGRVGEAIEPQPNGCWLYRGRTDQYGRATVYGKQVAVHRFVFRDTAGLSHPGRAPSAPPMRDARMLQP